MENTYKIITGFMKQDRTTIERHLALLAENFAVYSEHIKGFSPHLEHNDIYFYIHERCIVLVCIDNGTPADELADEDNFRNEAPLYFASDSHRTSPVWKLAETMRLVRLKLREADICGTDLWGVLLSESNFINADNMKDAWEDRDISVIDNLKGLAKWRIGVNPDPELTFGAEVMATIEGLAKRLGPEEAESAKAPERSEADLVLEQLIDEFVNGETSEETEGKASGQEAPDDDEDDEPAGATASTDSCDPDDLAFELPENSLKGRVKILKPLANPRAELDKLVGCADIKERIDELLALTRYNAMVAQAFPGAKPHDVSLHSLFLGRPGTGKTTVCKIFGSLLREAGALSRGHVVATDRGTFIGKHWGDEEDNVRQAIDLARGGVLMIDEAYLLNSKNEQDPGKLVLQLLMDVLADEQQRDIAVVLCGYKEPMMKLLETNPGLLSRFPNRFEFNDFTVDELIEITNRRIGEYHYSFTEEAWLKFKDVLAQAYSVRDPLSWGNARFVANQLERIYIQHARRCVSECPADTHQLRMLTPADILPIDVPRPRQRIGF